jgi:hypothetical protein
VFSYQFNCFSLKKKKKKKSFQKLQHRNGYYLNVSNEIFANNKITVLTLFCISHILARRNILYSRIALNKSQTGKGEEECSAFATLFTLPFYISISHFFVFYFYFLGFSSSFPFFPFVNFTLNSVKL